jgi:hypothetical protein
MLGTGYEPTFSNAAQQAGNEGKMWPHGRAQQTKASLEVKSVVASGGTSRRSRLIYVTLDIARAPIEASLAALNALANERAM